LAQALQDGILDEQTKFDILMRINESTFDSSNLLNLVGSRTKALRDYANQVESNLESNLFAQKDCQDQISNFFGAGLSNLAMVRRRYI